MAEAVSESLFMPMKRMNYETYPSSESSTTITNPQPNNNNIINTNTPTFLPNYSNDSFSNENDFFSTSQNKKRQRFDLNDKYYDMSIKSFNNSCSNFKPLVCTLRSCQLKEEKLKDDKQKLEKLVQSLQNDVKNLTTINNKKDDDIKILRKGINIQENKIKKLTEEYEKLNTEGLYYINSLQEDNKELKKIIEKLIQEKNSAMMFDNKFINYPFNNPPPPPSLY